MRYIRSDTEGKASERYVCRIAHALRVPDTLISVVPNRLHTDDVDENQHAP